jgi:hypothetical protein
MEYRELTREEARRKVNPLELKKRFESLREGYKKLRGDDLRVKTIKNIESMIRIVDFIKEKPYDQSFTPDHKVPFFGRVNSYCSSLESALKVADGDVNNIFNELTGYLATFTITILRFAKDHGFSYENHQ